MKMSGDLDGTPGITLVGPERSIYLPRGVIIAKRHIHMLPEDAQQFGVVDGQVVSVQVDRAVAGWEMLSYE